MPRKKRLCPNCQQQTSTHSYYLTFEQCDNCDGWKYGSPLELPLAVAMTERGFDFHAFADQIDQAIAEVRSKRK